MTITFTVVSPLAQKLYSSVLFAGANPTYSNANNLVLTSDASVGINIAKQFVAQVHRCTAVVPVILASLSV